jgi:hypothetical protein
MTAIVCMIPVTAMSHPPFSKVLIPMIIQRSSSMDWTDISSTTIHPRTRFIHKTTDDIPVPPQFQLPSSCQLNMSPHELELMLFINKNFLKPSIFDKVMKWAHSATADGNKFDSPIYSTLKKPMNYAFPNTIQWMVVLSNLRLSFYQKNEVGSDLPVTMWYFEQSYGVVCKVPLIFSSHEGLWLVCFLQRKYTDCGSHVYDKNTSAD